MIFPIINVTKSIASSWEPKVCSGRYPHAPRCPMTWSKNMKPDSSFYDKIILVIFRNCWAKETLFQNKRKPLTKGGFPVRVLNWYELTRDANAKNTRRWHANDISESAVQLAPSYNNTNFKISCFFFFKKKKRVAVGKQKQAWRQQSTLPPFHVAILQRGNPTNYNTEGLISYSWLIAFWCGRWIVEGQRAQRISPNPNLSLPTKHSSRYILCS